jgi:CBS domain-containing protein
MAAYTRGQALRDLRVDDAMAKRVFSCAPDDDVDEAETKMAEAQIRRLPVVDGAGHPVGMLSLRDVARATASEGGLSKHRRAFAEILAAICRPGRRAVEAV